MLCGSRFINKHFRIRNTSMLSMFSSKSTGIKPPAPAVVQTMTVERLQEIIKANEINQYQLVDVREENELDLAKLKIEGVVNLPLSLAGQWTQQIIRGEILDLEKPVLCLCHHGVRSMKMASFLVQNEFESVYNIEGGIAAYAVEVDPSIGFY